MNNPYRARPARARVDHSAVTGYGSQNQNAWNSIPTETRQGISPANIYQQQPNTMIQQPEQQRQSQDPWDWDTDNGNNGNTDPWNWSIDQKSDSQQQQPPQHSTPHQFSSGQANNSQSIQNPQSGNYYQNVNRNNRPNVLNQHPATSGGNTPRTSLSRESTPNHKDGYNQYVPYDYNQRTHQQLQQQQYHLPPRPNSKSSPAIPDHLQWSASSQQAPSLPLLVQSPNAQHENVKKIQTPPLPPQAHNYNWHSGGQQSNPSPNNWQNHNETPASGSWHGPTPVPSKQPQPGENIDKWQQEQQTTQKFVSSKEFTSTENNDHLNNWNNPRQQEQSNLSNQGSFNYPYVASNEPMSVSSLHQNSENTATNQWHHHPIFQPHVSPQEQLSVPSAQQERNVGSSQWQQPPPTRNENIATHEWNPAQRSGEFGTPKNDAPAPLPNHEQQGLTETNVDQRSLNDWQHGVQPPPSHFASSTASTTSHSTSSMEKISSAKDSLNEKRIPANSTLVNDAMQAKPNTMERKSSEESHWPESEMYTTSTVQNNTEAYLAMTDEWNAVPTTELSSGFSQLSISSKSNEQLENQAPSLPDTHSTILSTDRWASQSLPESSLDNPLPLSPPADEIPPSHLDNVTATSQEHILSQIHQPDISKTPETVSQNAGYDQWYAQRKTVAQPENHWYRKNHQSKSQKWPGEQNIENYENVQLPSEFVNLEVVTPMLQKRNIYGSHDSINRETLDNEPKTAGSQPKELNAPRDFQEDINNVEVLLQHQAQQSLQAEQAPDNYEFASNDRNTFLETGELTDSHQQHEPTPPSQDDENDEVPNDIPFLREVPGQSSSSDPRRNDPTGQEENIQIGPRSSDPRRNIPSGQEHAVQPIRNIGERAERRDVPPGQERNIPTLPPRADTEILERRNDPSGRERSLPPQQSRNDVGTDNRRNVAETRRNEPSGEECLQPQAPVAPETNDLREIPGRGNDNEEPIQQSNSGLRQIPGGASPSDDIQVSGGRDDARVVTGSQEVAASIPTNTKHDQPNETRSKREEAVGASLGESQGSGGPINQRDSYEEGDDEGSGNSRDESRERRRERTPERRGYDYDRKSRYHDREREFDEDYYYEPRRPVDFDRAYNSREDLDRREVPYRDDERRHVSREDIDRRGREQEDPERRGRGKDDLDERRRRDDDRRKGRGDVDLRTRDPRDYDPRYFRDREYPERERRREPDRRGRRYDDYDPRDPYRRDYYEDPYTRNSRPSSRSSYNDRDRDYYARSRDPYYGYNGTKAYGSGYADYGGNYGSNYLAYLENLRQTNPAAYMEWYYKYYASQHQQPQAVRGNVKYPEDRASVHSGRSSCDERSLENPSFCFHSPNKALSVSYFGPPGCSRSPLWRHSTACHSLDRTTGDKRTLGDISLLEDTTESARLTPTKFSTSHVQATFSTGSLIRVHASYPADGELARVDVLRVSSLLADDPVVRELVAYPGPLIKQVGVTHKKTIIEYCEAKIKRAESNEDVDDPPSYILLYKLMVLLIRQNGNVVGVDIAELLLSNQKSYPYIGKQQQAHVRRESVVSQKSTVASGDELNRDTATPLENSDSGSANKSLSTEQITDRFRELLLYGCGQEALEYAMNNGLWGHALFLASKLDKRTHASVMTRFANGLTANDPLQTLYQLQSGRVPASVTCVAEPKWGDWRPHLAMIISNTSPNPEINRKSITTLGDTLMGRGHIHAAHFCYILAQVDFGAYGTPTNKLVLLGSNPHKAYNEFVTNEAIMLTEIYEYARNLSEPGFTLVDLQTFKFGLAVKMVDYGLTEKALLYIEQIAVNVAREPLKYQISFIENVHNLGDRIKYNDPVCKDSIEDAANLSWLNNMVEVINKYKAGEIIQDNTYDAHGIPDANSATNQHQEQHQVQQTQQQWTAPKPEYSDGPTSLMEAPTSEMQQDWQPMSLPVASQDPYTNLTNQSAQGYVDNSLDAGQHQQPQAQVDYWGQPSYTHNQSEYAAPDYSQNEWQQQSENSHYQSGEQPETDNAQQEWNYESEKEEKPPTPDPHPTISMGRSSNKQYDPLAELDALDKPPNASKPTDNKKTAEKQSEKKNASSGGGSWFGGFFSKLAPKPKNQMILPDDNNPTIVWDALNKKWTNKDADNEGTSSALAPPPKASEMGFQMSQSAPMPPSSMAMSSSAADPASLSDDQNSNNLNPSKPPSGNNMFKMAKGRNFKANYIDVMNPGGLKAGTGIAPSVTPPTAAVPLPSVTTSPQFFIPAPVNDPAAPVDFLTSASVANGGENSQQGLSRWSSASSLSREVQSYTMRDPRLLQQEKGPMMFNPTEVKDSASKKVQRNRYPPR